MCVCICNFIVQVEMNIGNNIKWKKGKQWKIQSMVWYVAVDIEVVEGGTNII